MKKIVSIIFLFSLLWNACSNAPKDNPLIETVNDNAFVHYQVKFDSLNLVDTTRNRLIPLAIYSPEQAKEKQQVVIVNHGYGRNKGGDNRAYSYLTNFLASKGYYVVSIQHELTTDDTMPLAGNPQVVRRPFWERGVQNILFVLNTLKKTHPELDYNHVTLIGHSNGGDMAILFAQKYPEYIHKVISLDNRRMAFPRTSHPKIYSLRSSDQVADSVVIPTLEEQKKFGITIIKLPNTIHNDMDDNANDAQRKEINDYVLGFLREE